MFRYFWYRVNRNIDVADDLTQETFTRAFANLSAYEQRGSSYRSYLYTIAHNLLVSHYRSTTELPLEAAERLANTNERDEHLRIDIEILWRLAERLPRLDQLVLTLFYRSRKPIREIGQLLGKSDNAVKLLLSRSRSKLRQLVVSSERMLRRKPPKPPTS
jgi:RNA polymerase sigma-70 factor (ECF subfamily)